MTDYPTAGDTVTDGETGLICAMTPEAVAEKILRVYHEPELRRHLAEQLAQTGDTTGPQLAQYIQLMLT